MFDDYFAMRSRLWALFLVLGACTKPNPASCLDDFCDDPALPFCDVDGSIGGVPDTCIAVQCTPQEFQGCRDDHALTCSADGVNIVDVECEFGCGDEGCLPCNTPECQPPEPHIIPRYTPEVCDDVATTQLMLTDDLAINTSDDANCMSIVPQASGPEICVIHHESIAIPQNKTLRFTGARVVALVADRQFDLEGVLDASANSFQNGPGGGFKKSGGGGDQIPGGGAGNRTRGGHGGNAASNGGALNGGAPELGPTDSVFLLGGTQPTKATQGRSPGGAGGGVTLVCCRCDLSVSGTVDVSGGGGEQGFNQLVMTTVVTFPAGGGGSGGTVVLQGMEVTVEGQLFSNGGGGGGGGTTNPNTVGGSDYGGPGQKGPRASTCALGGTSQAGGVGGRGGCGANSATDGLAASNFRAGGGGGSAGFLLALTPEGVSPVVTPSAVSPAFEPNGVIPTN